MCVIIIGRDACSSRRHSLWDDDWGVWDDVAEVSSSIYLYSLSVHHARIVRRLVVEEKRGCQLLTGGQTCYLLGVVKSDLNRIVSSKTRVSMRSHWAFGEFWMDKQYVWSSRSGQLQLVVRSTNSQIPAKPWGETISLAAQKYATIDTHP